MDPRIALFSLIFTGSPLIGSAGTLSFNPSFTISGGQELNCVRIIARAVSRLDRGSPTGEHHCRQAIPTKGRVIEMIGPRVAVGLALLCAFLPCAFAAQGASAKGTTAFTCEPGSESTGFKDAHCDEATAVKAEVKFVHKEIEVGKETEVETTNEKTANKTTEHTPAILKSTRAGVEVVISCTKVVGTGTLLNTVGKTGKMHVGGSGSSHYTECKVTKPVKEGKERCTVKSPGAELGTIQTRKINAISKVISEAPEEMGGELTPSEEAKGIFVELEFGNAVGQTCPFSGGGNIPVEGSIIGTAGNSPNGKGATVWFNTEGGMQKLTFGGATATLTVTTTGQMSEGGNAIAGTTTAN